MVMKKWQHNAKNIIFLVFSGHSFWPKQHLTMTQNQKGLLPRLSYAIALVAHCVALERTSLTTHGHKPSQTNCPSRKTVSNRSRSRLEDKTFAPKQMNPTYPPFSNLNR